MLQRWSRRATRQRETKATPVRTYTPKPGDVEKNWYVIDATDVVLGRLAAQAATLLRGKHKPQFAPNEDCGDYVVIINADKVALTNGKADKKFAYRHSGHPGGLTAVSYRELLATRPERAVEKAIKGMVPHTKLGRAQLKKLKVYVGGEFAARRYEKTHGHPPKNRWGESLFDVSCADGLRYAETTQDSGDAEPVAAFPRYHPSWAWWMTKVPGLREVGVSNLVLVLRKR